MLWHFLAVHWRDAIAAVVFALAVVLCWLEPDPQDGTRRWVIPK